MRYLIFILCITLAACSPKQEIQNPVQNNSCFNDLNLSYNLHYDFGEWSYKPVYKTNIIACLPYNSGVAIKEVWEDKNVEVTEIYIPDAKFHSLDDAELYSKMESIGLDDPVMHITISHQGTWSSSSIRSWIEEEIGGAPRISTWNKCKTLRPEPENRDYKTIKDYLAPLYIDYKSPVYPLKNAQGDFVLFEACNWAGTVYAVLINYQVYIVDFDHGFYKKNIKSEELLKAILSNLKASNQ